MCLSASAKRGVRRSINCTGLGYGTSEQRIQAAVVVCKETCDGSMRMMRAVPG